MNLLCVWCLIFGFYILEINGRGDLDKIRSEIINIW